MSISGTAARNGMLCYGYNGEIYTLKEGEQPRKVAIRIVTDQTEQALEPQIKTSGATEIAVSPDGKEIAIRPPVRLPIRPSRSVTWISRPTAEV